MTTTNQLRTAKITAGSPGTIKLTYDNLGFTSQKYPEYLDDRKFIVTIDGVKVKADSVDRYLNDITVWLGRTVQAGQEVSIGYSNGAITDADGNDLVAQVDLTVSNQSTVENAAPVLWSSKLDEDRKSIQLKFSEALKDNNLDPSEFSLKNQGRTIEAEGATIENDAIRITLDSAIQNNQNIDISYEGVEIQDRQGNPAQNVSATINRKPPKLVSAALLSEENAEGRNQFVIELKYDEPISESPQASLQDFIIKADGNPLKIKEEGLQISPGGVLLFVEDDVKPGQTITLNYGGNAFKNFAGNKAERLNNQLVVNKIQENSETGPTNSADSTDSANPSDSADSTGSANPTDSANPTGSANPSDSADSTDSANPTDSADSTDSGDSTDSPSTVPNDVPSDSVLLEPTSETQIITDENLRGKPYHLELPDGVLSTQTNNVDFSQVITPQALNLMRTTNGGGTIASNAPDGFTDLDGCYLNSGAGNDIITGSNFADFVRGGAGDDLIDGGAGDDLIRGGAGRDVLRGGDGVDMFYYTIDQLDNQVDVITDFNFDIGEKVILEEGISFSIGEDNSAIFTAIVNGVERSVTCRFDGNVTVNEQFFLEN